ncbi:ABC transporter ATP-binding protein [Arsenicicoccus dermatophilus]|uniref:ABC transporter ATP-binding protein n=1 Tax=Arsenicicoccus dermatophilus TaxID=1076331 RepID=UPI001F4CFE31|nr:ABC transporter ATP-binding protein [Arsenicicoccus dermatophilus]MCH8614134.1 ABC transporter ATP-binding protein [Arsenicicoccus dermatophilus]
MRSMTQAQHPASPGPAGAAPALLTLDDVRAGYRRRRRPPAVVLDAVSAQVGPGELVALVGPNGSGKSTLLRTIAQLQPALRGRVLLEGEDACTLRSRDLARRLAAVLTDRFDPGRLRACEVVALGRHPHRGASGRLSARDHEVITASLTAVDALALGTRELASLSDGQRQRVMVARALAQEPKVLLLDEPTSFLDPPGRIHLLELLREICTARRLAVVVCTHDIETILAYADQVWVAGRDPVMHVGVPEVLAQEGLLGAPFATPGVRFRLDSLTFEAVHPDRPGCHVHGHSDDAHLARHCLRRAGLAVDDGVPAVLTVSEGPEGWIVHDRPDLPPLRSLVDLHSLACGMLAAGEEPRA